MHNLSNENMYNHIPLDLPNILLAVPVCGAVSTGNGDSLPSVAEPLRSLARKLAMRNSDWKFIGRSTGAFITGLSVYKGGEEIGLLSTTYRGSGSAFVIRNRRTKTASGRHNHLATKDVAKAVKLAEKYFYGVTKNELVSDNRAKAAQVESIIVAAAHADLSRKMQKVTPLLVEHAKQNWLTVRAQLVAAFGTPEGSLVSVADMQESLTAVAEADKLRQAYQEGKFAIVSAADGQYVIDNQGETSVYDELPEQYKRQVGLLKLAEPNILVYGTGFKASPYVFFVILNKEE